MAVGTTNVGFEDKLWLAADKLRGSMDASEYKHVVLGLIFLKYVSDAFNDKYQALVSEGSGFEEDKDEYTMDNIFYVPVEARWSTIASYATSPEIGKVIDNAMEILEKENPALKGVLNKNYARPELDKTRLGELVTLFTNVDVGSNLAQERDVLGRVYEYFLGKFASAEGKLGGEFYTPSCVVRTLVEILEPFKGRIFDPACGSGGMFCQSAKFIKEHQGNVRDISVYGQEFNPTTWKLAKMNLAIDARNLGYMVDRRVKELSEEDIQKIAETYHKWRNNDGYEDVQGFCKAATIDEISENDYVLTPGRYVGIEEVEDDGIPFEEKMEKLTSEISQQFKESRELEEKIRKALGSIGFEI